MRFYGRYKDTESEWQKTVPTHWSEYRIKDIALLERGKFTHRPRNDPRMYGGDHPFIQTGEVARAKKYITDFRQTLSDEGIKVSRKFKKGTLLMAIAANIGDVAIVDFDTYFPDSIIGFTVKNHDRDYVFYLLSASRSELDTVKVTSTQDNLNLERLNSMVKYMPPLEEQRAIADYLESKTAQIDRKIDLLEQKASKYAELKQSLINETVTKGLDKTVGMKDSGLEWVGTMPSHWILERLKDCTTIQYSNVDKKSRDSEQSVLLCNYTDVYNNDYIDEGLNYMEATANISEISRFTLKTDDVIVTKDSETFEDIASPALVRSSVPSLVCGYHLALIRTKKNVLLGSYLLRLFQAERYQKRFRVSAKGITRVGLGKSVISDTLTPIPPIEEQRAIADYLDEKTSHIDTIISTIGAQIEKLHELRKTLINDVVTGKLKVTP